MSVNLTFIVANRNKSNNALNTNPNLNITANNNSETAITIDINESNTASNTNPNLNITANNNSETAITFDSNKSNTASHTNPNLNITANNNSATAITIDNVLDMNEFINEDIDTSAKRSLPKNTQRSYADVDDGKVKEFSEWCDYVGYENDILTEEKVKIFLFYSALRPHYPKLKKDKCKYKKFHKDIYKEYLDDIKNDRRYLNTTLQQLHNYKKVSNCFYVFIYVVSKILLTT